MFNPLQGFLHGDKAQKVDRAEDEEQDGSSRYRMPWFTFAFLGAFNFVLLGSLLAFMHISYRYRFTPAEGVEVPPGRYLVRTSPTQYLLCSAVPVVVAFLLIAPIVKLNTYSHARYMLQRKKTSYKELTLKDGEVLITVLTGRVTALGAGLKRCMHKNRAHPQVAAATALLALLLFTAAAILAGDMALHGSTKSVRLFGPATGDHLGNQWGRTLADHCDVQKSPSWSNLDFEACAARLNIGNETTQAYLLDVGSNAFADSVSLSGDTALLVDTKPPGNASFVAATYGVTTTCESVGNSCQIDTKDDSFLCPKLGYSGTFNDSQNANSSDIFNLSLADLSSIDAKKTNFYLAMKLGGKDGEFKAFANDASGKVNSNASQLFAVYQCTAEIRSWRYRQSYGYIYKLQNDTLEAGMTPLTLGPMFQNTVPGFNHFGSLSFSEEIAAAIQTTSSIEGIAMPFAHAFSKAAISTTASITKPILNSADLDEYVVATIHKALFWYFVASVALYMLIMTTVLGLAIRDSRDLQTRKLQYQLTLEGIADQAFELLANDRHQEEKKLEL